MKMTHHTKPLIHLLTILILAEVFFFLFVQTSSSAGESPELQICQSAIENFNENYQAPSLEFSYKIGHRTLMLIKTAGNAHVYGWDNLVIGIWDNRFHCQIGKSFVLIGDSGQWEYRQDEDGSLLITVSNGTLAFSEYYSTGIWLLTFDGKHLDSQCIAESTVTHIA